MPRAAADLRYAALERRIAALEKVVAQLVQALEDEADQDDAPLEDLMGNRIDPPKTVGRADAL